MVKLIIFSVLSAALAVGSEHALNGIDKGNVKKAETIAPADSIPVNLKTRSILAPALDTSDAH